jgi:hypothetical protein
VSVECADRPDVKKIHLFGDIPYTLTVRNLEFAPPPTTAIGGGGKDQEGQESGQTTAKRVDVNKHHHRSFELVSFLSYIPIVHTLGI